MQAWIDWQQRRIIVHSYIYYEMDGSVVTDRQYDKWSKQLVGYKRMYPELWKTSEYYKQFGDDYNGATGFTLYPSLNEKQQFIIRSIANVIGRRH